MIEFLKNWVLSIVTLALFIVLLEIIIPSGKIKKFVNLISGFILIITIINPFLNLFKSGIDLKQFQMAESNFIDKSEIEKDSKVLKDSQMKQIVDTYRNKIIFQIEDSLSGIKNVSYVKGDVIINEDYNSETFGEIKRVYVNLRLGKEQSQIKPVTNIEKVEIGGMDKKEKTKEPDPDMKNDIESKLFGVLGVSKEIVVIKILG